LAREAAWWKPPPVAHRESRKQPDRTCPSAWTRTPEFHPLNHRKSLFAGFLTPTRSRILGVVLPVCCPRSHEACLTRQQKLAICRSRAKTGATGLEPATSGVTGRVGRHDAWRRTPLNGHICRAFQLWSPAGTAWLSQSSNRRSGHEWATKSCLNGQRSGWQTREIACAKTRIVFSFPSHRRCFVRADALALVRARPDASPRHAGAGGACLSSRRRPSRINPAVPIAA
jgi:hypothetical protein